MDKPDVIVIGAGMVGSALAYGLAKCGLRVVALDGADTDFRAARANFGLVWVQGKGPNMAAYQRITRQSSDLWPTFADELRSVSNAPIDYERNGGVAICLGDQAFEDRRNRLQRLHNQLGAEDNDTEMIDRRQLEDLMPRVTFGPEVVGASYCWRDGHANPLQLMQALQAGLHRLGGEIRSGQKVTAVKPDGTGFMVETASGRYRTDRVVLAAGIATSRLGRPLGLDVPVRPQRGQVLVTERLDPFLPLPASGLRQTAEGTVMIGATQEEVGEDVSTTTAAAAALAHKTMRIVPALAGATLVRQWAGLRVMTPDSYPIYAQSRTHPGAFAVLCHSGVTLAAIHAERIARDIEAGALSSSLDPFHHRRFDVSTTELHT